MRWKRVETLSVGELWFCGVDGEGRRVVGGLSWLEEIGDADADADAGVLGEGEGEGGEEFEFEVVFAIGDEEREQGSRWMTVVAVLALLLLRLWLRLPASLWDRASSGWMKGISSTSPVESPLSFPIPPAALARGAEKAFPLTTSRPSCWRQPMIASILALGSLANHSEMMPIFLHELQSVG